MTRDDIAALTAHYASARAALNDLVGALQAELDGLTRAHLPAIRAQVNAVADLHARLNDAIASHPGLFEAPRTISIHGVKIGLQKGKGRIEIDDEAATIARIKRLLPDQAEALIQVTESLRKSALNTLDAGDLCRIGVQIEGSGDTVVIKPADSGLDKVVRALLKDATDEALAA